MITKTTLETSLQQPHEATLAFGTPQSFDVASGNQLVLSDDDSLVCDDYIQEAAAFSLNTQPREYILESELQNPSSGPDRVPTTVVMFLNGTINPRSLRLTSLVLLLAQETSLRCVVVIRSLRRHLDEKAERELDQLLARRVKPNVAMLTVIRTGILVCRKSRCDRWSRRLNWIGPLLGSDLSSTFVRMDELCRIVREELASNPAAQQQDDLIDRFGVKWMTLLGERRSWRDILDEQRNANPGPLNAILSFATKIVSTLGGHWIFLLLVRLLSYVSTSMRELTFTTLAPTSEDELLQLCHRHSRSRVQIAGYNNGVNHFGWKFPSKTVVVTTSIQSEQRLVESPDVDTQQLDEIGNRVASLATARYTTGAGTLLRDAIEDLARTSHEFFVVPNFSYVSMGTLFFVPIHGSGSHISTLGDTIAEVELWNCITEERRTLKRSDPQFRELMYCRDDQWIALRLTLWVKGKSSYIRQQDTLDNATADVVLNCLSDARASNVEVRKQHASSRSVDVNRYFVVDPKCLESDDLPLKESGTPQDKIGRLWDRIEETPVISTLFHWFVRNHLFHVELFLTNDEFRIFWEHHQSLPISKIQIRRILKDGIVHSACRDSDCVAADIIMNRRSKDAFCRFVREHIPNVRSNSGKQSL